MVTVSIGKHNGCSFGLVRTDITLVNSLRNLVGKVWLAIVAAIGEYSPLSRNLSRLTSISRWAAVAATSLQVAR